jgi:hypothetical protein
MNHPVVVPELQRFYGRVPLYKRNDTDNRFKPQVQPLIVNSCKLTGTERK